MRALITGGHGFVGRHLAQHLVRCGDDVAATYFPQAGKDERLDAGMALPTAVQAVALDVTDLAAVKQLFALMQPDVIFHLAGISFVPQGEDNVRKVFDVNTIGTINVLDAVQHCVPTARVLVVGSSEAYGLPRPGSLPWVETSELRPISAYGASKAAADLSAFKYSYRDNVHVIRIRPFPHVGPGQSEDFAISSFAKQVASVKLGLTEPIIKVGNLDVKRDYSDVSDIVRGYHEALLNGKVGEVYNLCSGESVGIGELLQMLVKLADVEVEIVEDPARVRTVDIVDVYGSYQKATKDFGWKPRVEREAMLDSILAYWLDTLSKTK